MRRHELSDAEWEFVRVLLPVLPRGRRRLDDRQVLNGIVWKFRAGTASGGGPWTARSNGCSGPPGKGRRGRGHRLAHVGRMAAPPTYRPCQGAQWPIRPTFLSP
ncbi:transposase [Streptomyces sp. NPDC056004]|uniref:transposase n=1 Tax=Streptomyces sp. NPDC056004 TaxID=3345677 RepID=UPI0035D52D42